MASHQCRNGGSAPVAFQPFGFDSSKSAFRQRELLERVRDRPRAQGTA